MLAVLPCVALSQSGNGTFMNPILNATGADPWVVQDGGYYYMTYTTNSDITLLRSKILSNWDSAESKVIFQPEPGMNYSTDLWAPEIHSIGGSWWVIFTADPNNDSPTPEVDMYCTFNCPAVFHRMYVLHSGGPDIWTSNYTMKSQLDTFDQFAIDGTYFQHSSGLYHVYSCWYSATISWPANLCITKMSDPFTVSSTLEERQIISEPTEPWEKTPYNRTANVRLNSNEGPQQLTNPKTNQTFIIYSAARSDNRNYCLGQLELIGTDPMNPQDWKKHEEGCIFYQNPDEESFGVGHASFVKSPDGSQDWIVYHGMRDPANGWAARTIRTQEFTWAQDGSPSFPRPGYGPYKVPSGE
ncbi:glycoside hydrolase family 43 protein [Aulographum hederae CBS 113979]|uniref:Glycoside hydrolase family 43 protein n=1 Tax=Aulographum hederae CBS 113979 TaxID=1176131 RepID=A0A6G1GRY3_9PEZI|nr:glycoside hydrolase family 43 protein [Aulographum hederae CBS 113979]